MADKPSQSTFSYPLGSPEQEDELRRKNQLIQGMLYNLPVIVWRVDKDGTITESMGSGLRRLGLMDYELLGSSAYETYPKDAEHIRRAFDGQDSQFESILDYNGEKCYFLNYVFPDYGRKGVVCFSIDITEQKQAKKEHQKAQERYEWIFRSSSDAMNYTTVEGVFIDVNDAFCKLTGYNKDELIDKMKYHDITPGEYRDYEENIIDKTLLGGQAVEYEKDYIRKDGTRISVHLDTFLVRAHDGKPKGFASIIKRGS